MRSPRAVLGWMDGVKRSCDFLHTPRESRERTMNMPFQLINHSRCVYASNLHSLPLCAILQRAFFSSHYCCLFLSLLPFLVKACVFFLLAKGELCEWHEMKSARERRKCFERCGKTAAKTSSISH
jgi:hypothetical protein